MATDYNSAILEHNDIEVYWDLDEASGTTGADSAGSYDLTHNGSPTVETGLLADGGNARGYATGTPNSTAACALTTIVCVEAVFQHNITQSFGSIISRYTSNTDRWRIGAFSGSAFPFVWIPSGNIITPDENLIADGDIHHLVVQWTGSTLVMYIDGIMQEDTSTTNLFADYANGDDFCVGDYFYNSVAAGQSFNGNLDAIALYSAPLSVPEILQHNAWVVNGYSNITRTISGLVQVDNQPAAATVSLYDSATKELRDSQSVLGAYSFVDSISAIMGPSETFDLLCEFDDTSVRPLAHVNVAPVET